MMNLYCIPHAGGSASVYYKWKRYLDSGIRLQPIELCGRGSRQKENFYSTIRSGVEDIYTQIRPELDQPFALFGHSMGSLFAYELCIMMKERDGIEPLHLFVSGRRAPHLIHSQEVVHTQTDEQIINEMMKFRGAPREFFNNSHFLDYFLPIIRADYKLIDEYSHDSTRLPPQCGI